MRLGSLGVVLAGAALALPAGGIGGGLPATDRQAGRPGPGRHDLGRLPAGPGHQLGRPVARADGAQAEDRGRRGRLLRPAVRDHAAQAERSVRQPADRRRSRARTVPKFYADFNGMPSALNNGHTVNEYWMEQTHGRIGMTLHAVRPVPDAAPALRVRPQRVQPERRTRRLPGRATRCNGNMDRDVNALWRADAGREHPPRSSTSSCASTPATTRRRSGRSSAR